MKLSFSIVKNVFNRRRKVRKKASRFTISKRQQFVLVTVVLTILLIATQFTQSAFDIRSIAVIAVVTYVLSAIAIREDLSGIEFVTLFILPTFFTIAVSSFYFLLPSRLLTRLPIALLYTIGMYAILLTENIYNVAAIRTIALLRAAQSVGFLLTLVTVFFLIDAVVSLHINPFSNMGLVFVISFPLALQSLWSMELDSRFSQKVLIGSFAISLILAETVFVLSFWPIRTIIESLFLTTIFYTFVGMGQQHLVGRLFKKTQQEFLGVLLLVFLLVLFTTKWGFGHFVQ